MASCVRDCDHGGLFEASVDGDGTEPCPHRFDPPDEVHLVLLAHLLLDGGRHGAQPDAHLAKDLQESVVVELTRDPWPYAVPRTSGRAREEGPSRPAA